MTRELTGRHVLIIAMTAFGVIIAANMTMLFSATGTFPGLVVKNAYVASQGWNERTQAQAALGWRTTITYQAGAVVLTLTDADGKPVRGADLTLVAGRPTTDVQDITLAGQATAAGYRFAVDLAPGAWRLELSSARGDWQLRAPLYVPGVR